jgi:hypothetical protein
MTNIYLPSAKNSEILYILYSCILQACEKFMPDPVSKNSILNKYLVDLKVQFPEASVMDICTRYMKAMKPRTIETSTLDDFKRNYETVMTELKKEYGK